MKFRETQETISVIERDIFRAVFDKNMTLKFDCFHSFSMKK
jgi:hypothetical protein